MRIKIYSYKKAQVFKKDFVYVYGEFVHFERESANHRTVYLNLKPGDTFEARGSIYCEGMTRWDATKSQSWAKFEVTQNGLVARDFDGNVIPTPKWVTVRENE